MGVAKFPTERADGSFAVAVRFSLPGRDVRATVETHLAEWVRKQAAFGEVDLATDLLNEPRVVSVTDNVVDIVFEGRPGARDWKDWLVDAVQELTSSIDELVWEGFLDLATGAADPKPQK